MSKRSSRIIITNEARVLRALRIERKLSMKEAAKIAGISDSLIAHIETGRIDSPRGPKLDRLLKAYGNISSKAFAERVRRFQPLLTEKAEATELLKRMNQQQVKLILPVLKGILQT